MVQTVIFNNLLIVFLISLMQLFQIFGLLSPTNKMKENTTQRGLNVNLHDTRVQFRAEQERDEPILVPEAESASSDPIARSKQPLKAAYTAPPGVDRCELQWMLKKRGPSAPVQHH